MTKKEQKKPEASNQKPERKAWNQVFLCIVFVACFFSLGACARVRVEAPKDPIKVDISMRLDIYQHVAKDIDSIEDMVSGSPAQSSKSAPQSRSNLFISAAFAQDSALSPEVEQAALRRKNRRPELISLQEKGVLGESKSGLVETIKPDQADEPVKALVKSENADRMVIYEAVANKNGTSVAEVQKLYAKRLQNDAPSGALVEVLNEAKGAYEWQSKP